MKKEKFLKIYANLPVKIREEIILVLDDKVGPITWNVAYIEINNETNLGKKIFDKLIELKII